MDRTREADSGGRKGSIYLGPGMWGGRIRFSLHCMYWLGVGRSAGTFPMTLSKARAQSCQWPWMVHQEKYGVKHLSSHRRGHSVSAWGFLARVACVHRAFPLSSSASFLKQFGDEIAIGQLFVLVAILEFVSRCCFSLLPKIVFLSFFCNLVWGRKLTPYKENMYQC